MIDASVWVAASASPAGGSALVIEICGGKRFTAVCTQRILMEAQTNIRHKLSEAALVRFYELLTTPAIDMLPEVTEEQEAAYTGVVAAKDAHVMAAAMTGECAYLVTLDRKHLANDKVRAAVQPLQILLPAEFIQQIVRERQ